MNNSQQPTNYNMGGVQSEHFDGFTALSCFYLHYLKTFESGERGNNTGLETHTQLGNKKPNPIIMKGKKKKWDPGRCWRLPQSPATGGNGSEMNCQFRKQLGVKETQVEGHKDVNETRHVCNSFQYVIFEPYCERKQKGMKDLRALIYDGNYFNPFLSLFHLDKRRRLSCLPSLQHLLRPKHN